MVLSLEPVRSERLVLPLWTAADVAAIRASAVEAPAVEAPEVEAPEVEASTVEPSAVEEVAQRPSRNLGVRGQWHPDFPREDDIDAASLWHEGDVWGPRSIVRGVTVLGSIGFFGPPEPVEPDGVLETEVGYGLVPEARGWGFATESLRALLAETDAMGVQIRASVRPDNATSLRVLAKAGFTRLRGTTEDGELVMVRPLPSRPLPPARRQSLTREKSVPDP